MNKINSPIPLNHVQLTQQNSPASARPAIVSQTLTPLTPPGGSPSADSFATRTEQSPVPPMRLALFERTFGQVQQMLTERRQTGGEASAQRPSGLTGNELRECDAVAQWVSERLMPSGSR